MKAERKDGTEYRGHLTTEHSASSYGQPVVVFSDQSDFDDGQGYAWGDLTLNGFIGLRPENDEERELLRRFNGWHPGSWELALAAEATWMEQDKDKH